MAGEFVSKEVLTMRLILIAAFVLSLTQCSRPSQSWRTCSQSKRQQAALAAASHLLTTFADDCALRSGARDVQDTSDLERRAWLNGCKQFKKLGHWKSLRETTSTLGRSNDFVLVEGRAVFDAGEYRLESFWRVRDEHAEIFFLGLKDAARVIDVPNYPALSPGPLPNYRMPNPIIDPPPGLDAHS
jgi:hypothetical protein